MLELKEGYGYAPTLVCVCSDGGAVMCADSRMVTVKGDKAVFLDDCRRVFKVNERLLYGCAGMFPEDATLVEPLTGRKSERLNADNLAEYVNERMLEQMATGTLRECVYVIAGLDRVGRMCVATVRYDEEEEAVHTDKAYCADGDVIFMNLPPAAAADDERWERRLRELLEDKGEETTGGRIAEFIRELAGVSKFVGGNIIHREISMAKRA